MPRARFHLAIVLGAAIVFLLGTSQSVAADPVKGTHKAIFPVSCAGQTYLVVGGRGAAAQVLESTAVLIPAAFVQVSSWTDPVTGQVVTQTDAFSVGQGKRTGQQDTQISCTYQAVFS